MRLVLHILTREPDELTRQVIASQRALEDTRVEVCDLSGPQPDYAALIPLIFSADSVEVC